MKLIDLNDDRVYTIEDLKREWETFRKEEPWNHAEDFKTELFEILMATVNGRNDMEILDATPDEVEQYINNLREEIGL